MSQMAVKESQSVSVAQSTAVVKNCVRLAVSTVAFSRELFPKEAFVSKNYAGVNLEVLRPIDSKGNVINEGALRVHEWLEKGAFKALDQNYLEKVTFNILDAHPSDRSAQILESYSFKVSAKTDVKADQSLSMEFTKKKHNATSSVVTSASSTTSTVTREEVHAAMQKLVRTLVMLTSSLGPLPSTRWLSMSITYNDAAPAVYEAPEFCPQDPNATARFAGEEPLVIGVGEVDTGFQTVSLKFRQAVTDEEQNLPSTQKVIMDAMDEQAPNVANDGYDSDNTQVRWAKDKKEILTMAERIAQGAKALGKSPEAAVRSSELGKTLSDQALSEVLSQLQLNQPRPSTIQTIVPFQAPPPPNPAVKRVSRVKRPLQQICSANEIVKDEDAFESEPAIIKKKTRQTYGKRH